MSDMAYVSVTKCLSCGRDHASVKFTRLNPKRFTPDGAIWEWVGKCPDDRTTILMSDIETFPTAYPPEDLSENDKILEAIRQRWQNADDCHGEAICEQAQADIQTLLELLDKANKAIFGSDYE